MTWLYLNDTVLQKRNTFFVINSTAEIRQDTLSYTLTLKTHASPLFISMQQEVPLPDS